MQIRLSSSHLSPALVQLLAAFHHGGAVGVGHVDVVCCSAGCVVLTTVFSGDNSAPYGRDLAIHNHFHATLVGSQVSLGLHDDAVALVGTVMLAHVLVEEQAAVSDPGQDDANREEEQGHQGLPHLEQARRDEKISNEPDWFL